MGTGRSLRRRRSSAGLGLAQDRLGLPVKLLSGGERRRLELARILFGGSDLLLLDEPTNHLDVDAKVWLMKFLAGYKGALMVISHDMELLDASITRILHLDVTASWSTGAPTRSTAIARGPRRGAAHGKLATRQDAEIKRLKTLADQMRGQTVEARPGGEDRSTPAWPSSQRAKVEGPPREKQVRFRFPEPPHCGRTVLTADGLAKDYGGPPVFADVTFAVGRGERLLVLGLNGAGKTSLLRILTGQIDADAGTFAYGHGVEPGYYAQEHEGIRDGVDVLHAHEGHVACRGPDAAVAARHVRAPRRDRVPGRRHALRRREDQARAGAARRRSQEPAAARRAHEQPRSAVAHGDRRGTAGAGRAPW